MKYPLLLLLGFLLLASCTTIEPGQQAPRPARRAYQKAQRHHERQRRQATPHRLPWN